MEHLSDFIAIDSLNFGGVDLKIVRDDIFPFIGGGNKARKALYYERFLKNEGYNAVVTCGGIQSNHNRAMALMAARNHWPCHLCIQGTPDRFFLERGNALLDRLSGAECELIDPKETSLAMDRAMEELTKRGFKPYYVHGGGHDLPGGVAFVDAVDALKKKCDSIGYKPDCVFLPSGTGSTQAGILVGIDRVGWNDVKVIGVSVARRQERGKQVVADFTNMLAKHYCMDNRFDHKVIFCDEYLFGGYEHYSSQMGEYLEKAMAATGFVFDSTYSGKAFYGMMEIIKKHDMKGLNILFWHTGGIMNIMR